MVFQILGRSYHHLAGIADPAHGQRAVGQMAEPHRHIGLAGENVDHFVAESEVDDDVRVAGAECRHQRNDGLPPMAARSGPVGLCSLPLP